MEVMTDEVMKEMIMDHFGMFARAGKPTKHGFLGWPEDFGDHAAGDSTGE